MLQYLETILARFNSLVALPNSIGSFISLKHVDIRDNKLTELPTALGQIRTLSELLFEGNPLKYPPADIRALSLPEILITFGIPRNQV